MSASAADGKPLLIVCSSGGHLLQMLELRDAWSGFERVWVTFDKSDARSLLREERVLHAHSPTNRNIPNLLRNLRLAARVLREERPAAILTTGAGVAVPFAWAGRLFGVPTVYVESVTRIEGLSLGPTNRNVPNLLRNLRLAARVLMRERPSAILTTGQASPCRSRGSAGCSGSRPCTSRASPASTSSR